jgi:hypothetical protein
MQRAPAGEAGTPQNRSMRLFQVEDKMDNAIDNNHHASLLD